MRCIAAVTLLLVFAAAAITVSALLRRHRIVGYTVQAAGLCPVKAVLFRTRSGKTVCADPEEKWVKQAMQWVDGGQEKAGGTNGPDTKKRGRSRKRHKSHRKRKS